MSVIKQGTVFLDSCIFIYLVEENKTYLNLLMPLFQSMNEEKIVTISSELTLMEILIIPIRNKNQRLVQQYESILYNSNGLKIKGIDKNILKQAAFLRANSTLKTPDAIQMAVAIQNGCNFFLTNDRQIPKDLGIKPIQLNDYL